MANPLLSIITVSYNSLEGLKRTCRSLSLAVDCVETILIDGLSSDGTAEWIRSPECRYTKVISELDDGIYDAMNKGIALAQGRYLLFMNCGDRVAPELPWEELKSRLGKGEAVYIGNLRTDDGGRPSFSQGNFTVAHLFSASLPHQAAFIPKAFFDTVGVYDLTYSLSADQEWFLRALRGNLAFHALGFVVAEYAGGGVSERPASIPKLLRERRFMLLRHLGRVRYFALGLSKNIKNSFNRSLRLAKVLLGRTGTK